MREMVRDVACGGQEAPLVPHSDGDFTVEADVKNSLIRIAMHGFFGPDDIARFIAARAKAHARLTCGPNEHLTLNDLRGMKIQSQQAVTDFRAILADPAYRSRRLAFVVSETLARSQLMRALAGRDARCFSSVFLAEAWLLGVSASPSAPRQGSTIPR